MKPFGKRKKKGKSGSKEGGFCLAQDEKKNSKIWSGSLQVLAVTATHFRQGGQIPAERYMYGVSTPGWICHPSSVHMQLSIEK